MSTKEQAECGRQHNGKTHRQSLASAEIEMSGQALVSHGDIMTICRLLADLIKLRRREEQDTVESTIGKPVGKIEELLVGFASMRLDEVEALHDRLFLLIPEDML